MANKSKIKMLAYGSPIPRDWNDFREPEWRNDNYITDEQYKYMQLLRPYKTKLWQ